MELHVAVIGAGAAVFNRHRDALKLPEFKVVAIADINPVVGLERAAELDCQFYTDHHQLLAQTHPDITVVMTPHPLHAQIAIDALQAGSNVLVEKPMAVQVSEADAMIDAAHQTGNLLGVVLQHRFRPVVCAARHIIQEGQLGKIQHVEMAAAWPRPAKYYQSAAWRGTWAGEGGGVLMNQAPHHLDLLCHLIGLPSRVFAWTRKLLHQIETEDTVQAMLEWPGGTLGSLRISTALADQSDYLKIVGSSGILVIQNETLSHFRFDLDMCEFASSSADHSFPKADQIPLTLPTGAGNHMAVYRNFYDAIQGHTPFISTGKEGRMSLELANSLIYSGYTGEAVELPLNRQRYAELLTQLQRPRNQPIPLRWPLLQRVAEVLTNDKRWSIPESKAG